jgi:hypothetical protein
MSARIVFSPWMRAVAARNGTCLLTRLASGPLIERAFASGVTNQAGRNGLSQRVQSVAKRAGPAILLKSRTGRIASPPGTAGPLAFSA